MFLQTGVAQPSGLRQRDQRSLTMDKKRSPPKEEFIFGNFNHLVQGNPLVLGEVVWE